MPMAPLLRWTVRLMATVLVVALAALLALRIYGSAHVAAAEREFARKIGPREATASVPANVPDGENAAVFLRAGAEAMILPGNDRPQVGELSMAPAESWSEAQRADVRRILANNGPTLERLHRAAGMTRSNFGAVAWDTKTHELTTPPLLKLMTAQRLLLIDARIALLEHDSARLLADAASMATMAAGLERETATVELQVGMACEKMLLAAVGEAVAEPSIDRETLTKLQGMLVDTDLRVAWRRSNLWQQTGIQGHVAAVMSDPVTARAPKVLLYGRFLDFAFGRIFQAQQLEIRADLIAAVDQPLGLDPPWLRRGLHQPRTILDMFDVFESVMFGQTAKSSIGRVQSTLSLRELARIALEVRLQGLATGSYPETLASLPGGSNADPFAGKPLSYVRRPDGSARISVPNFEALWKHISDVGAKAQPFSWELPAPATPKPGRNSRKN
jgi:hypothetical protein